MTTFKMMQARGGVWWLKINAEEIDGHHYILTEQIEMFSVQYDDENKLHHFSLTMKDSNKFTFIGKITKKELAQFEIVFFPRRNLK